VQPAEAGQAGCRRRARRRPGSKFSGLPVGLEPFGQLVARGTTVSSSAPAGKRAADLRTAGRDRVGTVYRSAWHDAALRTRRSSVGGDFSAATAALDQHSEPQNAAVENPVDNASSNAVAA